MYENGYGVSKDQAEAINSYRKAAGQNEDKANKALERLGVAVK